MAALAAAGFIPWTGFETLALQGLVPGTLICVICCTAFTIHEGLKYKSQYEVMQARLASLESRLRPHFLFNTLNSIVALIPEDPAIAEHVVVRLSDLLRYSLDAADRPTVQLEQELKVATNYLEIEKLRFGARLEYGLQVPPELLPIQVPPFCLQTLVENSVKYGGTQIRIGARKDGDKLVLIVWDSGQGFDGIQKEIPGHGLHDLRTRMATLWGSQAGLEYPESEAGSAVEISIPCRPTE
jgi:LytS/YehU family sensor histidine kinase